MRDSYVWRWSDLRVALFLIVVLVITGILIGFHFAPYADFWMADRFITTCESALTPADAEGWQHWRYTHEECLMLLAESHR